MTALAALAPLAALTKVRESLCTVRSTPSSANGENPRRSSPTTNGSSRVGYFFTQALFGLVQSVACRLNAKALVDEVLSRALVLNGQRLPLIPSKEFPSSFVGDKPSTNMTQALAFAVSF